MSQKVPSTDFTKLIEAQSDATISAEKLEIQKVTQASKHLTDQATELQSQLDSGTLNLKTQRQKISRIISHKNDNNISTTGGSNWENCFEAANS
ncbi:hypothetical protein Tco_1496011 [Tanacetum coccineum]